FDFPERIGHRLMPRLIHRPSGSSRCPVKTGCSSASFRSVEKRRRRATPVMTSTFENVSDIGVCLGLYLGPPAKAGVRSKQGAVQPARPCRASSKKVLGVPDALDVEPMEFDVITPARDR